MRYALALAALLALVTAPLAFAGDVATIAPDALVERLAWGDQSLVVLDVRTPEEYAAGHVVGARNIPHTEIVARIAELAGARDRDLVVYCRSGRRSELALEALREGKTIGDSAQKHDVHPNQVTEWRRQLLERAADVFGGGAAPAEPAIDVKALHAKIGQLTLENDFLESALDKAGLPSAKR